MTAKLTCDFAPGVSSSSQLASDQLTMFVCKMSGAGLLRMTLKVILEERASAQVPWDSTSGARTYRTNCPPDEGANSLPLPLEITTGAVVRTPRVSYGSRSNE